MAEYVVRVGDQDDYHLESEIGDVAERLRMSRVMGPVTPYYAGGAWCDPALRGKVMGVEAHDCRRNNYISLFVSEDGTTDFGRSITDEELADLNGRLPKVKDDYPDGECPDCGESIPDAAWKGDACENCGHVFTGDVLVDD